MGASDSRNDSGLVDGQLPWERVGRTPWSGSHRETGEAIGFWPRMSRSVRNFIAQCEPCQRRNDPIRQQAPLQKPYIPSMAGEVVGVDFVGPLSTRYGSKYLLTAVDHFTKFAEAYIVTSTTAETVARVLVGQYIPRHGVPQRLVTDRGTAFTSELIQTLCRQWGITKIQTTAYHPQGNGVCERFHRTFANVLAKIVKRTKDWETLVPVALAAYRATPHKSTGYTPNFLTYGRELRLPNTCEWHSPGNQPKPVPLKLLLEARQAATSCLHQAWRTQSERINRRRTPRQFEIDDYVYLRAMQVPPTECKKFWSPWTGPWRIVSKASEVTYEIVDKLGERRQVVHINRLKPAMVQGIPDDALVQDLEPPVTPDRTPERVAVSDDSLQDFYLDDTWEDPESIPEEEVPHDEPTSTPETARNSDDSIAAPTPPYALRPRARRDYLALHKKGRMARVEIEH